jgi:hypothetical protein
MFKQFSKKYLSGIMALFFLVMPYSTSYKLKDYGFGSGGTANSTGGGFSLNAITGEQSGTKTTPLGGISLQPGLIFTGQANVPIAPTFINPGGYYNKLNLTVNPSGNPSDTKFAIAISTDNFATITNYVQNDNTVGAVLGAEDYQTYSAWGGVGGITVIGLTAGTTYQVKIKAMQGKFSETGYGPTASAATVNPTLSFSVGTDDNPSTPPFIINFGNMVPGNVNVSPHYINVGLDTNGVSGGRVYVYSANAGLYSSVANYKINAMTGSLTSVEGFGAQGRSGGTLTLDAPYDQIGTDTVGIVNSTVREIFNTAGPITGGTGSFLLKSRPATTAPAATDYAELLTVIAAGSF